jgi:hypothetical protein
MLKKTESVKIWVFIISEQRLRIVRLELDTSVQQQLQQQLQSLPPPELTTSRIITQTPYSSP